MGELFGGVYEALLNTFVTFMAHTVNVLFPSLIVCQMDTPFVLSKDFVLTENETLDFIELMYNFA